jgi:hypothetical protein
VLALWGGVAGLVEGGVARPRRRWMAVDRSELRPGAIVKLMPSLAASEYEASKLAELAATRWREHDVRALTATNEASSATDRFHGAWRRLWSAIVQELYAEHHISRDERTKLLDASEQHPVAIQSPEAIRRLNFFLRSLRDPEMPPSEGALRAPGLSVLVPSYNEVLTLYLPESKPPPQSTEWPPSRVNGFRQISKEENSFLKTFFMDDFERFEAMDKRHEFEYVPTAHRHTGHALPRPPMATHSHGVPSSHPLCCTVCAVGTCQAVGLGKSGAGRRCATSRSAVPSVA